MITISRVRPLLIVMLFAGYYGANQPPAQAAEFCDQICGTSKYCGWGCYDETGGLGYTDCWTFTGGDCDPTYPSCDWPYSSGNWPIESREKIGTRNDWTTNWWPPFFWEYCYDYYRVHAVSLCGLGEHDFCEKELVKLDGGCDAEVGYKCDELGIGDCYPGNDCH